METDEVMLQMDNLLQKVEDLIERCHVLERENSDLSGRVKQLESELEQKVEAENQFSRQKAQIRSKIDNLLAKIDNVVTETPAADE